MGQPVTHLVRSGGLQPRRNSYNFITGMGVGLLATDPSAGNSGSEPLRGKPLQGAENSLAPRRSRWRLARSRKEDALERPPMQPTSEAPKTTLQKLLDAIERVGNKVPHPAV